MMLGAPSTCGLYVPILTKILVQENLKKDFQLSKEVFGFLVVLFKIIFWLFFNALTLLKIKSQVLNYQNCTIL